MYNELKKGIQMQNLMPSVKFYILCISHSIQNFPRVVDAISYYVDLYKSKPQKLPIVKSILPLYSWASPSFLKTGGRKAKLASDFCLIVQVDYTIFKPLTQVKSHQFYYRILYENVVMKKDFDR